jgi:hypothetical protein
MEMEKLTKNLLTNESKAMPDKKRGKTKKDKAAPKLNIYELETPKINERNVLQLARRFRLQGSFQKGSLTQDKDTFLYKEGQFLIRVDKNSGAFRFVDSLLWQVDDRESNLTMEDQSAARIATRFIDRLELAPKKEYKFFKTARLHVAFSDRERKNTEHRIIGIDVCFQRIIDGLPVDGPGGKIIVSIGTDKKVTGCEMLWRKVRKIREPVKAIRQEEDIIEQISKEWQMERSSITVHEIRFGYFEDGLKNPQKYLQPAYIVFLGLGHQDRPTGRRTIYVAPAATNAAGRITPVMPRPKSRYPSRVDNK